MFNRHYFGSIGSQTCWTPVSTSVTTGCTSYPYAYVGSPSTVSATLEVHL